MVTTVNTKGQVTIPGRLRERYGFPPGTKVVWVERGGEIIPRPLLSLRQLRGRYRGRDSLTEALLAERAADRRREDV